RVRPDALGAEVQRDGLGQRQDGALAGGVGCQQLLGADRVDRAEVHDGPAAGLDQLGDRVFRAQEDAFDVDVEGPLVVLHGGVQNGAGDEYTRVVDDAVELAERS